MTLTCPHCWQTIDIEDVPPSDQPIELVADCEVCCRPIRILVDYPDPDSDPYITAEPES